MDHQEELGSRAYIPRLPVSKLPMPRAVASYDNLKQSARTSTTPLTVSAHPDDLHKKSHLPRPSGPVGPLGENVNQSIRTRYGWATISAKPRSQSPVRDALREASSTSIDTTPPSSKLAMHVFEDGNENPLPTISEVKERRQPRPSLSERTIETLVHMSPTTSPTGTRPSLFGTEGTMAPPLLPASSMRESRASTPATSRSSSPTRRHFLPPGRLSPTKDLAALPPIISPGDIYTPPKAFVKGARSRIAKPLRDPRRSVSSVLEAQQQAASLRPPSRASAKTVKVKPTYGQVTSTWHSSAARPSLSSIFTEPLPSTTSSGNLAVSNLDSGAALLRPRSRGDNPLAPSTPPSKSPMKQKRASPAKKDNTDANSLKISESTHSPKSSAALRETIAKAKAARKKAVVSSGAAPIQSSIAETWTSSTQNTDVVEDGNNKSLLSNRIRQAVTSGQLNIAGMRLTKVPSEVMKMYEMEGLSINWSEMVDLVKLNAADNEIEELDDTIFPDYTESDLADDDEKCIQFGGIEFLDLHRNQLQSLPVGLRRLERLQTLNLNGNKLTSRAFDVIGQIAQLKELMIADNLIEGTFDLGILPLARLQLLDLHGNSLGRLTSTSVSGLPSLKILNLAGNKLATLPWESLSSLPLTELNVSNNQLSGILLPKATAFPELRILDASQNTLEEISGDDIDLPCLRSLILSGNRISSIPTLRNCKELQVVEFSENLLEEIPSDLALLDALKAADFGNNNIRLVSPEIARLEQLSSLNLVGNPLREKKYLTMGTLELKADLENKLEPAVGEEASSSSPADLSVGSQRPYRYTPSGGVLDLSSQSLTVVNIEEIDLKGSESSIHTLKLSNNDLSRFPVELISHPAVKDSICSLDLSHNPCIHPTEYLSSELFLPRLKSLYIVSTGLSSLDALTAYLKAPGLTELNISCHRLAGELPTVRTWWPNCHTLLATDNWFSDLDVESVRGLEVLDIRNNEIEGLPPKIGLLGNHPGSPKAPGKLRVLEVSGNKFRVPRLTVIEKGTEAILKDLRRMISMEDVPEEWRDAV